MNRRLSSAFPFLSLLPFCVALVSAAGTPSPRPMADPAPLSPLAFQQYSVNLREVRPQPVIPAYFNFTNRGDQPIRITALEASCGCLTPQLHDRHLPESRQDDPATFLPGERGRFYVAVRTANEQPGPHAWTVNVRYEDSEPHEELLVLRMTLPEKKLSVEPAELIFYPAPGRSESQTTYVTDFRDGEIDVLEADCQIDFLQVEVLPRETDERGQSRVPVRVTVPADFPPGRHTGILSLRTSDTEFERIYAAVLVHGQSPIQPVGGIRESASDE